MVGIQNKCFVNFKILRYVSIKSIRYELISVIKITIFIGVIVTSLELQIVRLKKKNIDYKLQYFILQLL